MPTSRWIRLSAVLFVSVLFVLQGCGDDTGQPSRQPSDLLPGIKAFLETHSEFGRPVRVEKIPDWWKGPRQRVEFASGRNLLFYLSNGHVVSICEDTLSGRKKIWGDYQNGAVHSTNGRV